MHCCSTYVLKYVCPHCIVGLAVDWLWSSPWTSGPRSKPDQTWGSRSRSRCSLTQTCRSRPSGPVSRGIEKCTIKKKKNRSVTIQDSHKNSRQMIWLYFTLVSSLSDFSVLVQCLYSTYIFSKIKWKEKKNTPNSISGVIWTYFGVRMILNHFFFGKHMIEIWVQSRSKLDQTLGSGPGPAGNLVYEKYQGQTVCQT